MTHDPEDAILKFMNEQLPEFAEFMEQFSHLAAVGETPLDTAKRLLGDPSVVEVLETARAVLDGEVPSPTVIVLRPEGWFGTLNWDGDLDSLEDALQDAINTAVVGCRQERAKALHPSTGVGSAGDERLRLLIDPVRDVPTVALKVIVNGLREGSADAQALAELVDRVLLFRLTEQPYVGA